MNWIELVDIHDELPHRRQFQFVRDRLVPPLERLFVIVHGLLHLIGYDDHTESDIAMMRSKENYYLDLRKSLSA